MRKLINILLITTLSLNNILAQYNISITINGLKNKDIYLAHYFGDKTYVVDTAQLDNTGHALFKKEVMLQEGIYMIVLPSRVYFDIIIDSNQIFSIETDTSSDIRELVKKLAIKNSSSNTIFRDYQIFMFDKTKEAHLFKVASLDKTISDKKRNNAGAELEKLNKQIKDYQTKTISANPQSLLAKVIKAFEDPIIPKSGIDSLGIPIDSIYQYNYYKDHYFDNIDFSDQRLLRTPIYFSRLTRYFDQVVSPIPDSVINASEQLLKRSAATLQFHQYTLQFIFNKYSQSNIMGHDGVTVYLADNYYLNKKASWVDDAFLKKLEERVTKMRPNIIGAMAPNLDKAQTPEGMFYPLHSIKSKYIAIVFWEPGCGHCKKEIPMLLELFHKYHNQGFEIYSFYTQSNIEEWTKAIDTYNIKQWINVYDPFNFTKFRETYDVYSTPTLYLIDENFKILAKRFSVETLNEILNEKFKTKNENE